MWSFLATSHPAPRYFRGHMTCIIAFQEDRRGRGALAASTLDQDRRCSRWWFPTAVLSISLVLDKQLQVFAEAEDNLDKQIKAGKGQAADLERLRYERFGVEIDLEILRKGMSQ